MTTRKNIFFILVFLILLFPLGLYCINFFKFKTLNNIFLFIFLTNMLGFLLAYALSRRFTRSLIDRENTIQKYQQEIQGRKEYLVALFNSMVDGIITISEDCIITNVNPTIAVWAGSKEEDIIDKPLLDFIKCNCTIDCLKDKKQIAKICPLITQNERLSPSEAQITNIETGIKRDLGLTVSKFKGMAGDPAYVIVLRDITELKELDRMREDFIATLTHDLRVPIIAEASTLKFFLKGTFGTYNDKQKEAMENMLESNSDLLKLVNSLLDTYRYEAGEEELSKESVNIRKLAQDCIADLTPTAKRNNQTLTNLISRDIPLIKADKNEIKRVLINLISNGLTYTSKGGLVTVDAEGYENEVIVKVTDTGKGISKEEIDLIFDRFFSKAKKLRKIGTGLGLYLSKKIIEKHNGKIWVESELGKGSTFYFSLPVESI